MTGESKTELQGREAHRQMWGRVARANCALLGCPHPSSSAPLPREPLHVPGRSQGACCARPLVRSAVVPQAPLVRWRPCQTDPLQTDGLNAASLAHTSLSPLPPRRRSPPPADRRACIRFTTSPPPHAPPAAAATAARQAPYHSLAALVKPAATGAGAAAAVVASELPAAPCCPAIADAMRCTARSARELMPHAARRPRSGLDRGVCGLGRRRGAILHHDQARRRAPR